MANQTIERLWEKCLENLKNILLKQGGTSFFKIMIKKPVSDTKAVVTYNKISLKSLGLLIMKE